MAYGIPFRLLTLLSFIRKISGNETDPVRVSPDCLSMPSRTDLLIPQVVCGTGSFV